MKEYLLSFANDFTILIEVYGYFIIFILMLVESTIIPLPSEIIMIPAGVLSANGKMNLPLAIFAGAGGSLAGAYINYFIAYRYGNRFLLKYGKYFFLTEKILNKTQEFFYKHGALSTFIGRLIPGARHYISLPAGFAKMPISKFSFYTILGAGIWCGILAVVGFMVGNNQELIKVYLQEIAIITTLLMVLVVVIYIIFCKYKHHINSHIK